ncbi:hypothetical protein [Hydrogenophaga sp.]|uniref:hypothetical protein n=1 Tax=Hydrogenophaga sp. TaxID=1904254 RepID=UPI003D09D63F
MPQRIGAAPVPRRAVGQGLHARQVRGGRRGCTMAQPTKFERRHERYLGQRRR